MKKKKKASQFWSNDVSFLWEAGALKVGREKGFRKYVF